MKAEKAKDKGNDPSELEVLSIKERVEAANYAIEATGKTSEDEDVSDIIGEVYGG